MINISNVNFSGKKVLVRVDFNVPLSDKFEVKDDTRIVAALPTLNKVLSDGGKLIIMSHLGRPKGVVNSAFSLSHIVATLSEKLNRKVEFIDSCIGQKAVSASESLANGNVLLLENLRFHKEETDGDRDFALELSKHADFYVNDAFGTAHRAHASTSVIAEFFPDACCFGFLMDAEVKNVNKVLNSSESPSTAIVGGAKVSSKITILENLIDRSDNIIIAGGMAYTFILAKGGKIGNSLVETEKTNLALSILEKAKKNNVNILLPVDSVNASEFSNDADVQVSAIDNVPDGYMGLDIGPKSIELFKSTLLSSKTILWNGPLGVFELDKFSEGTKSIGSVIVKATLENGAFSLVGGGDSVAAAKEFGLSQNMSYVSTGGGAMLEFLEGKTLPGIKAVLDANKA